MDRPVNHFLLHLSYSTEGWRQIVDENAGFDGRLEKVRDLVGELGGSFANFHFHDRAPFKTEHGGIVVDKFAMFGSHDIMAVLAFPDAVAAQTFMITLRSFAHIADVRMTALVPFEHVINNSVSAANGIKARNRFSGPSMRTQGAGE